MKILGISAYYHDSAAALLVDGKIVAAAQEERFTRKKHDEHFPVNAIEYCLAEAGVALSEVDHVIFYEKPLLKFGRLLETYLAFAPKGITSFVAAMPVWIKEKLFQRSIIKDELAKIAGGQNAKIPPLLFNDHHHSHAASAFFPSPFEKAAVLCIDGVGEWATTTVWLGEGNALKSQWEINFPHSLGLIYSAFTYFAGFKVNSGEYKLMGLAPYGEPRYVDLIRDHLIDIKDDGSFHLNMAYFNFATGLTMTNRKFDHLFGGKPRRPESDITQREMDLARSIQVVTEDIVLKLAKSIHQELGVENLCLAGGVALNCVANGRLLREGPFKNIWVQPAAGDAGGALGAAYTVWHEYLEQPRTPSGKTDAMQGAYLGSAYADSEITAFLDSVGAPYTQLVDERLMPKLAELLDDEKVIGWFNGRMEFGPRALGGRSILGDPRSEKMQSVMNLKIKYRESFRPFAPAIKEEAVSEWFDFEGRSPYMLQVAEVCEGRRLTPSEDGEQLFGVDKLKIPRSEPSPVLNT